MQNIWKKIWVSPRKMLPSINNVEHSILFGKLIYGDILEFWFFIIKTHANIWLIRSTMPLNLILYFFILQKSCGFLHQMEFQPRIFSKQKTYDKTFSNFQQNRNPRSNPLTHGTYHTYKTVSPNFFHFKESRTTLSPNKHPSTRLIVQVNFTTSPLDDLLFWKTPENFASGSTTRVPTVLRGKMRRTGLLVQHWKLMENAVGNREDSVRSIPPNYDTSAFI